MFPFSSCSKIVLLTVSELKHFVSCLPFFFLSYLTFPSASFILLPFYPLKSFSYASHFLYSLLSRAAISTSEASVTSRLPRSLRSRSFVWVSTSHCFTTFISSVSPPSPPLPKVPNYVLYADYTLPRKKHLVLSHDLIILFLPVTFTCTWHIHLGF